MMVKIYESFLMNKCIGTMRECDHPNLISTITDTMQEVGPNLYKDHRGYYFKITFISPQNA